MSKVDINYFPYMERMKKMAVESGDRLEEALSYIDFIVKILLRYYKKMTPNKIRSLLKGAEANWSALVDQNIPVQIDPDDGEFQYLDPINFAEVFLTRVLSSAKNDEDYEILLGVCKNMCAFMGWGDLEILEDENL